MSAIIKATSELDDEDFALLRLALEEIEQKTANELTVAANRPEAALLLERRARCLTVRSKLHTTEGGCCTSAASQIAEARATALVLRATARFVRAEQGALMIRLNRAAGALDSMAALAIRSIERIDQLEQELRQLRAGAQ